MVHVYYDRFGYKAPAAAGEADRMRLKEQVFNHSWDLGERGVKYEDDERSLSARPDVRRTGH